MQTTRLTPYLMQLTQTFPFPTHAYLLTEADGFTLVDTGMAGALSGIVQALESQQAPLQRIVLTHAHLDHVGSLDALHRRFSHAEVLIGSREARLLRGDRTLEPQEASHRLKGSYHRCEVRPTRLLEAGDRVGSLEVVAAPGHTPGQIALLDTRDRSLLVGDAFSNIGGLTVSGAPNWRFPLPGWATWNPQKALETARRLLALEPSLLAMGHGTALPKPQAAMKHALEQAERTLKVASRASVV